jgi:hypothetical protein
MDNKINSSSKIDNVLDPFLFNFEILTFENRKTNPRLGDIWIPFCQILHYGHVGNVCVRG